MSAGDHLGAYAEGWTNGDADRILGCTTDDYVFDDPNGMPVPKSGFADYLAGLKDHVASLRGGNEVDGPFMELTEIVTSEADGELTAWCWWSIPGTPIQGAGLIKAGDDGVRSERIAFYAATK